MTLDEARQHIGKDVIYRPCDTCAFGAERGTITSVNSRFVFVRYGQQSGSKATPPDLLTLARPAAHPEAFPAGETR